MKKIKEHLKEQKQLEKETNNAEKALLVRHNKNMTCDLKRYIDCKRKLTEFFKNNQS